MINNKSRIKQVDILRFFAVILVIIFHAEPIPKSYNFLIKYIWNFWATLGWIGVDLFFVLSGFLVSGLIFNEFKKTNKFSVKQFLIRRGFKIYPSFWLLILFTVLIKIITEKRFEIEKIVGELLFIQNYLRNKDWLYWGHTWSLAIEEHFYIGLSILCFYLLTKTKKRLDLIPNYFVFIALLCLILRLFFVFYYLDKQIIYSTYYYTHFRIDSLFFGVLIAYLWHFKGIGENKFIKNNYNLLGVLGLLLYLPFAFIDRDTSIFALTIGYNLLALGSGFLLIYSLKTNGLSGFGWQYFAKIGCYSYSIYLWHLPIKEWLTPKIIEICQIDSWFFATFFYILASFVIGVILSKLIEYPILFFRDKYFPNPT